MDTRFNSFYRENLHPFVDAMVVCYFVLFLMYLKATC